MPGRHGLLVASNRATTPRLAMIWAVLLLTLSGITPRAGVRGEEIRIGYLWSSYGEPADAPAISMAVDKYQHKGALQNYNFSIIYRAIGHCSPGLGAAAIAQLVQDEQCDVILGPICSSLCASGGPFAGYWNIPMLPNACTNTALITKRNYPTLVRTFPSENKLGGVAVELLRHFNWQRAVVIFESGHCQAGALSIKQSFSAQNITLAEWIEMPRSPTDSQMDGYLARLVSRGRIALICFERDNTPFIARAHRMGMTSGEYVFLAFQSTPKVESTSPWKKDNQHNDTDELLSEMKRMFRPVKQITLANIGAEKFSKYTRLIHERQAQSPWNLSTRLREGSVIYAMFLHDAALLYLDIINEILEEGGDHRDGRLVYEKAPHRNVTGITGAISLDENRDRQPDFRLWSYEDGHDTFQIHAEILMSHDAGNRVLVQKPVQWLTEDGQPPPDTPLCGFLQELCPEDESTRNTVLLVSALLAVFASALGIIYWYIYRRHQSEKEIQQMLWKINMNDLRLIKDRFNSMSFHGTVKSIRSLLHHGESPVDGSRADSFAISAWPCEPLAASRGIYRGRDVLVYHVDKQSITLTHDGLLEMKLMREMSHNNLVEFVGACVEASNICYVLGFCSKGTLQDTLENDDIKLDWMFKSSLINDLTKGMSYIHRSALHSHGNLSSANCLIDNRWTLKISGYGLSAFKQDSTENYEKYRDQLWTAPELLREKEPPPYGTPAGDVYSFGIVMYEVLHRTSPFTGQPKEIIAELAKGGDTPLRPEVSMSSSDGATGVSAQIVELMKETWSERPENRPNFNAVRRRLQYINKGQNTDIMDIMVQKLERYASNLEEIVQQRTSELVDEKKKTDMLLYRMLPESVAEKLKKGQCVAAEIFSEATIYFSDIVGFTDISSDSTPMQVVDLLNDLYTQFDDVIRRYDVYKVETIGDAYMVVSGVPRRNGDRHAPEIADMTLNLLQHVRDFRIRHMPGRPLQIRIGIHTGPCAAGVVGQTMPRYCLFGDTVNMASRMESNGEANRIHLSGDAQSALQKFDGYETSVRGQREVKGKGLVTTYWLLRKHCSA